MKIEDQVVSLELAKKLKELGVKQESLFWWAQKETSPNIEWQIAYQAKVVKVGGEDVASYSAFSVAELGEMLPEACVCVQLSDEWCVYDQDGNLRGCSATEADARTEILLYLIENGLFKLD